MDPSAAIVDEVDLKLIHLLQVAPRVSWATAGEILGLSPSAVSARWSRLSEHGIAWLVAYPAMSHRNGVTALVDVSCTPKHRARLAEWMRDDPRVLTILANPGPSDFLTTVRFPSLTDLGGFVFDELSQRRGVTDTRTRVITELYAEGSDWRPGALDARERALTAAGGKPPTERSVPLPEEVKTAMMRLLVINPRISAAEVARLLELTPATAGRYLTQLLTSGEIILRCDTCAAVSGWPIECTWLTSVRPAELPAVSTQLRTLPQLRLCVSVTGDANLIFTTTSRSMEEFRRLETWMGSTMPSLEVRQSLINLRTIKRMGHMLDARGYGTGRVVSPL
ncbi:Lrp/AsnC family transcriptional regulator [Microbacterium sp. P5_E9]